MWTAIRKLLPWAVAVLVGLMLVGYVKSNGGLKAYERTNTVQNEAPSREASACADLTPPPIECSADGACWWAAPAKEARCE